MSKQDLLKKIKDGINKSGFPLELKIGSVLERNKWGYSIGSIYEDFETGKFREADISAPAVRSLKPSQWESDYGLRSKGGVHYFADLVNLFNFVDMLTLIVNEKSSKGKSLLDFVATLKANDKEIRIRKFRKVTDEEMALPGKPVSPEQLDEWLNRPDTGKSVSAEQLLARLNKKFNTRKK